LISDLKAAFPRGV